MCSLTAPSKSIVVAVLTESVHASVVTNYKREDSGDILFQNDFICSKRSSSHY